MTNTSANAVWIIAPSTCPVSIDGRKMAIVRNRAMMPSVMSIATPIEVPCATPAIVMSRTPGTT